MASARAIATREVAGPVVCALGESDLGESLAGDAQRLGLREALHVA
jgi:hypothetical protein